MKKYQRKERKKNGEKRKKEKKTSKIKGDCDKKRE